MIAKTTSKQTPFKNVVLVGFTVLLFLRNEFAFGRMWQQ